jgi:hypothetical protein
MVRYTIDELEKKTLKELKLIGTRNKIPGRSKWNKNTKDVAINAILAVQSDAPIIPQPLPQIEYTRDELSSMNITTLKKINKELQLKIPGISKYKKGDKDALVVRIVEELDKRHQSSLENIELKQQESFTESVESLKSEFAELFRKLQPFPQDVQQYIIDPYFIMKPQDFSPPIFPEETKEAATVLNPTATFPLPPDESKEEDMGIEEVEFPQEILLQEFNIFPEPSPPRESSASPSREPIASPSREEASLQLSPSPVTPVTPTRVSPPREEASLQLSPSPVTPVTPTRVSPPREEASLQLSPSPRGREPSELSVSEDTIRVGSVRELNRVLSNMTEGVDDETSIRDSILELDRNVRKCLSLVV